MAAAFREDPSARKTAVDWAPERPASYYEIKELLDADYPDAHKVLLACGKLNTHKSASLYQAFAPQEARRLLKRLEIHYTPKHGSWPNIAECELSVLSKQCLDRRIPYIETLRKQARHCYYKRNRANKSVDWQLATDKARMKLKRLGYSFAVMPLVDVHGSWPSLVFGMGVCLQGYAKTLGSSPDS